MGARETALRVLMSCRNNHAWADAALKAQLGRDGLVGPEAALCSRLVYGVVQNQQLLDFYLSAYCSQKPDHLQPPLLEILRLGAYQILYLDRVPDSAAVNTSVELAKISGRGQASGLVNAVLRKIAQNKTALPPIPERDEAKYLSIRYSHPKWLVKRLLSILGREEISLRGLHGRELEDAILRGILHKPKGHHLTEHASDTPRTMNEIGG